MTSVAAMDTRVSTGIPARPVLSEAAVRRIAELVAAAPPLSAGQRARIGAAIRAGRRLARHVQPDAA